MDQVAAPTHNAEAAHGLVFGSGLLRPWIVANFVAFTIGFGIGGGMLRALMQPAVELAPTRMDVALIAGTSAAAAALVVGAFLGVGQWLVLRQAVRAPLWALATIVGWAVTGFLASFPSGGASWDTMPSAGPITPLVPWFVILPAVIVALSGGQWLVLRRDCAGAGWWLLVNAGAVAIALIAGFTAAKLVPFIVPTDFPSAKALVVVGAVAGPVYGSVTWLFLSTLRRRVS